MGGNLVDYPGEVSTPTSYLTTFKLHVNIIISDKISCYMCMDVKDFYFNNQLELAEYIMIKMYIISEEFIITYNFKDKIHI